MNLNQRFLKFFSIRILSILVISLSTVGVAVHAAPGGTKGKPGGGDGP